MPSETIKQAMTPSREPDMKFMFQQTVGSALRLFVPLFLTKFGCERVQQDGNYELLILGATTIIGSLAWSVWGRTKLLNTIPPSKEADAKGDGAANG